MKNDVRTVLVFSDLTEGSIAAIQAGSALANDSGSELYLLHCVPRAAVQNRTGTVDQVTREAQLESIRLQLEDQRNRILGRDASGVKAVVEIGTPGRQIPRFANQISADVIVLGRHQPRASVPDLLGTTAERVLASSDQPCLLAHEPLTHPIRHVLAATDFSPHARHALQTVVDWLGGSLAPPGGSAVVEILHVYAFASAGYRPFAAEPMLETEIAAARLRLPDDTRITFRPRGLSAPLAVDGISRVNDEVRPDLLVMGTHGYGSVPRALLGSVASAVTRSVRRPLLVVPLHRAPPMLL
ncbi:MAG TPA: universal stress protein [Longimicrobiales bacterium]|nr:universal stress protein [Longimicrobiales bacterium]